MNQARLKEYREIINRNISARRVNAAIDATHHMLEEAIAPWSLRERLAGMSQSYTLMKKYALDGVADNERTRVYGDITNGLLEIVDLVNRDILTREGSTYYYTTLRNINYSHPGESIASLAEAYRREIGNLRIAEEAGADDTPLKKSVSDMEQQLFNRLWVTYPLSANDENAVASLMDNGSPADAHTRLLLVSALLLALTENYDPRAMYLLLQTYNRAAEATDTRLRMRAVTALLIAMCLHRRRHDKRFGALLATVSESAHWERDVNTVFSQLIRTRDTEKVNRKMHEEIIPQIMKMRPDITKRLNENPDSLMDMEAFDMNPEWEEELRKSGFYDSMRSIGEMQEEGVDVVMSVFAPLKHYPFFNEPVNWFMPFPSRTIDIGSLDSTGALLCRMPTLCNSDKFSIYYTLSNLSDTRRAMMPQLDFRDSDIEEMLGDENAATSTDNALAAAEVMKYVQDIYRFFKLFRRKGEFRDPFADPLNLATLNALTHIFNDTDKLRFFAEFYFRRGYYADALTLFSLIEKAGSATAADFQKMGFARQQEGDLGRAAHYYRKADLLAPDDTWTLRHLASCLRLGGHVEEAIPLYRRAASLKPDHLGTTMQLGLCLMETGKYAEATKQFFKVDYLDPASGRAVRPIAWCSFLAGDYDRAADYYGRIDPASLRPDDLVNMGHLAMATARYNDAVAHYRDALNGLGGDRAKFTSMFQADLGYLRSAGVDDFMTGLVLDSIDT